MSFFSEVRTRSGQINPLCTGNRLEATQNQVVVAQKTTSAEKPPTSGCCFARLQHLLLMHQRAVDLFLPSLYLARLFYPCIAEHGVWRALLVQVEAIFSLHLTPAASRRDSIIANSINIQRGGRVGRFIPHLPSLSRCFDLVYERAPPTQFARNP